MIPFLDSVSSAERAGRQEVGMSRVFVAGYGAVSPSGWGVGPLRDALAGGEPIPTCELPRPGWTSGLRVRPVPPPPTRPGFVAHARLRRTSPIAQYTVAAALEALGEDAAKFKPGAPASLPAGSTGPKTPTEIPPPRVEGGSGIHAGRLGLVLCVMSGCVNYSRRFYDEALKDPATASPLVFPETVFNAPASHLAALLGTGAVSYTIVGDPGAFVQGLAVAADWLLDGQVDGCLVIGAEELDWLIGNAMRLFHHQAVVSEGAGALYLRREPPTEPVVELRAISQPRLFSRLQSRRLAAQLACEELGPAQPQHLLCDSQQGISALDRDEAEAWRDWPGPRLSPKRILGEGFTAAAAWQCVAAVDTLRQDGCPAANVSVVGCNQQAIAAQFAKAAAPYTL